MPALPRLRREINGPRYTYAIGSGIGAQDEPGVECVSGGVIREWGGAQDMRDSRIKGIQCRCCAAAVSIREIRRV